MEYRTRARLRILVALAAVTPILGNYWTGWLPFSLRIEFVVLSLSLLFAMLGWAYYDLLSGNTPIG